MGFSSRDTIGTKIMIFVVDKQRDDNLGGNEKKKTELIMIIAVCFKCAIGSVAGKEIERTLLRLE